MTQIQTLPLVFWKNLNLGVGDVLEGRQEEDHLPLLVLDRDDVQ